MYKLSVRLFLLEVYLTIWYQDYRRLHGALKGMILFQKLQGEEERFLCMGLFWGHNEA
jgi:hypothetical protein